MNNKYLIDSNSFIASFQDFYSFDCFPGFWKWLNEIISEDDSDIVLSHCVYKELLNGNNQLSNWIKKFRSRVFDERQDDNVLGNYARVLTYLSESGIYGERSLKNWASSGKADPMLIAIAMTYGYKILTFERGSGQFKIITDSNGKLTNVPLQKHYHSNHEPKIPDVANYFGVTCIDMYEFEKKLQLKL